MTVSFLNNLLVQHKKKQSAGSRFWMLLTLRNSTVLYLIHVCPTLLKPKPNVSYFTYPNISLLYPTKLWPNLILLYLTQIYPTLLYLTQIYPTLLYLTQIYPTLLYLSSLTSPYPTVLYPTLLTLVYATQTNNIPLYPTQHYSTLPKPNLSYSTLLDPTLYPTWLFFSALRYVTQLYPTVPKSTTPTNPAL